MAELENVNFSELIGKIIIKIELDRCDNCIIINTNGGSYVMYHEQEWNEDVYVEDVCGDINYIINSPILKAEVVNSANIGEDMKQSGTYTFYNIATIKGQVTIRWRGTSDGYYSVKVSFKKGQVYVFDELPKESKEFFVKKYINEEVIPRREEKKREESWELIRKFFPESDLAIEKTTYNDEIIYNIINKLNWLEILNNIKAYITSDEFEILESFFNISGHKNEDKTCTIMKHFSKKYIREVCFEHKFYNDIEFLGKITFNKDNFYKNKKLFYKFEKLAQSFLKDLCGKIKEIRELVFLNVDEQESKTILKEIETLYVKKKYLFYKDGSLFNEDED